MESAPNISFRDGPRDGEREWIGDARPVVIGDGSDGGVYQRTGERDDDVTVYRWHPLTEAEATAILRGDLRANQPR